MNISTLPVSVEWYGFLATPPFLKISDVERDTQAKHFQLPRLPHSHICWHNAHRLSSSLSCQSCSGLTSSVASYCSDPNRYSQHDTNLQTPTDISNMTPTWSKPRFRVSRIRGYTSTEKALPEEAELWTCLPPLLVWLKSSLDSQENPQCLEKANSSPDCWTLSTFA